MPHLPDLARLAVGDRIQHPLLVKEVNVREAANGPFTTLVLGNALGELPTAPFWSEQQHQVAGIARGDVVQVIAEVGTYNDRRQLKVTSIRVLPKGSVDWGDLLPSVGDVAPYWRLLDQWRGEVRGPRLRAVLDLFYADDGFRARYERCPAAPQGHHAEIGGLLKHTWEVAFLGRAIAKVCKADPDLVLAGALLHDIGKLEAYRWEGGFETTEEGHLVGHVALGMLMLERRLAAAEPMPCTPGERLLLQHLVASHHGKLEYGATAPPMTLEAEVLHFADNASAKTASMAEVLAAPDTFAGDALVSARRLWMVDNRRVFRGASDWGRVGDD